MTNPQTDVSAKFPRKLQCLFKASRYKVLYGGRGGGKSWGIARALVTLGTQKTLRVLCARELQNSIAESVHKLLTDQISALGLSGLYIVEKASIRCPSTGTEFFFEGIRNNTDKIKSYEAVDICWVEEAHKVSKGSWEILIPTIRKSGSEIWISFNPDQKTDETFQRFVVNTPPNSIVEKITYKDNPWFTQEMRDEMEYLKEKDFDAYMTVWEGNCRVILDGAVYAQELRDAQIDGRITQVRYDTTVGVDTFWDLGWADHTAIWFGQAVGFEYRIIDYYEMNFKPLDHYLKVLQDKPYIYGTDWLPHDGKAKQLGSGRSIEELMRAKGRNVRVAKRLSIEDGINAARTIFPNCWFDEDKTGLGLDALRSYQYEINDKTQEFSKVPVHNKASHGADGFRTLAVALKEPKKRSSLLGFTGRPKITLGPRGPSSNVGWLGR